MDNEQKKQIRKKSIELGKMVLKTPEYENLVEKTEQLQIDEAAQKMILKLNKLQEELDKYKEQKNFPQELINKFEKIRIKLNENKNVIAFLEAQKNFNKYMYKINNTIAEGVCGIDPSIISSTNKES